MQQETRWLMNYFDNNPLIQELQDTIDTFDQWCYMSHPYASKNKRLAEWSPAIEELYDIAYHIFAMALLCPKGITYQAMIGAITNHVKCEDSLDRAKTAAEMIALAYQCDLIVITKVSDKTFMITTDHKLWAPMPQFVAHLPVFVTPEPVKKSQILGSRFKQHDGDTCNDHIDRMNAIPLTLELRVIASLKESNDIEVITEEDWKIMHASKLYDLTESQKHKAYVAAIDAWNTFVQNSSDIYHHIVCKGNRFYLSHSNDTRGRVYVSGYYVGYQGSSYKKAIVQLANKEVVKL